MSKEQIIYKIIKPSLLNKRMDNIINEMVTDGWELVQVVDIDTLLMKGVNRSATTEEQKPKARKRKG